MKPILKILIAKVKFFFFNDDRCFFIISYLLLFFGIINLTWQQFDHNTYYCIKWINQTKSWSHSFAQLQLLSPTLNVTGSMQNKVNIIKSIITFLSSEIYNFLIEYFHIIILLVCILMDKLCLRTECKEDAIFCHDKKCDQSFRKHKYCSHIDLSAITDMISTQRQVQKQLLLRIFDIENKLIEQLNTKRKDIIQKMGTFDLQQVDSNIIEQIYSKNNFKGIKGKQAKQLYENLMNCEKENNQKMEELIEKYEKQAKTIMVMMSNLRENIFQEFLHGKQKIDSKIILRREPDFKDQLTFISQSFGKPVKFQLLFRGSENQFSIAKFHEKCDNIEHTFSIIRNEFGKTIGGYTPLKWSKSGNWTNDTTGSSFLLSFDLKQKMKLTNPQYAIYCNASYGLTFGGGHDIYIGDKCHQNQSSYTNFPHSYNYSSKPYTANQQSYTAFSGATANYNFRVTEYEVFKVVYE